MKKHFFKLFVFSIVFLHSISKCENNEVKTLTMQEAVELGYKFRSSLKALQFNTQASHYTEKQALAGYRPQVSLNNYSFYAKGTKNLQNQITLRGSQLIYSFANPIDQFKIAKKGTLISKLDEDTHKNQIRNQVENAFLLAYLEQEKLTSIDSLDNSAKKNIKEAKHKKKLNLLDKNNWLIEKAKYAKDESVVKFYIDEKNIAQKELERLTNTTIFSSENKSTLKWNESTKIKTQNLNEHIITAIQNRPEVKSLMALIEKEHLDSRYYKNTYLPSVGINGEISRTSTVGGTQGTIVRLDKIASNFGLGVSWNFSDGGAYFHKSNELHAKKLKAMMEKESTAKQIKLEVETAYYELSKAKKEQDAQFIEYKQAKNEFELRKQEFEIGNISKTTFINTKTLWEQKQFEWLSIKINTAIRQNNLNFACSYSV